ncbi:EthD family reductase [Hydrogenophaga atypica]|uniref:EthD family reductase n=1 Tax=Hydrogenophaga atypica TaxID=249409 RepID=A0ABW2QDL7_9BURK
MIVRTAILEGEVKPEDRARFDAFVETEIVPLTTQFPGIKSVRIMRAQSIEDNGPLLYMTFESVYESVDAMNHAFTFPIRKELKAKFAEIMPLFHGRLFHITQHLITDEKVAAAK